MIQSRALQSIPKHRPKCRPQDTEPFEKAACQPDLQELVPDSKDCYTEKPCVEKPTGGRGEQGGTGRTRDMGGRVGSGLHDWRPPKTLPCGVTIVFGMEAHMGGGGVWQDVPSLPTLSKRMLSG